MVNHAKSNELKKKIARKQKDNLMAQAIALYRKEKSKAPGGKSASLRKVCQTISDDYYLRTNERINLDHNTLARLEKGGTSLTDHNQKKCWLKDVEEEEIVEYALETARRGFPLSPKRLREHVTKILQARLGNSFPEDGLGKNWATRFITRHHDKVGMYWSSSLDSSRGRAVNPITKAEYFSLIKNKREEYDIPDELVYGGDETGIQTGIGVKERVIGPARSKIQHQQRSGNRENITVLPTICADGTSIPPTVIFKGESFQTKWLQENPLDARMGYQKKGYTDGEIGAAWLADWDKLTKKKANNRYRLLLVDGHSSHYTMCFLDYARKNHIIVICYPSHSTHIYQGLDVVVFSVLKRAWSDERDKFERGGAVVSKSNFLSVYARAHVRTFTTANILAAFRKTGIVPFNPDVVTEAMMAPSLETSMSSCLPLALPSPVQEIVDLISHHQACKRKCSEDENEEVNITSKKKCSAHCADDLPTLGQPRTPSQGPTIRSIPHSDTPTTYTPVRRAMNSLASISASFLVSRSPISSISRLPAFVAVRISPNVCQHEALLADSPTTEREKLLMAALRGSQQTNIRQKQVITKMQAETILQSAYVEDVRGQLQGQEEKKSKANQTGRLPKGDGKAKILTQDDFFEGVKTMNEARDAAKDASLKRKDAKERYKEAMEVWKVRNSDRLERNAGARAAWTREVGLWETERDNAKGDRRKPNWKKPKMPPIEKAIPKPKVSSFDSESGEEEQEQEDGDGEISDDGSDSS